MNWAFLLTSSQGLGIGSLYYAFPALLVFYFLLAQIISVCTLQTQSLQVLDRRVHRGAILALTIGAAVTYVSASMAIECSGITPFSTATPRT